jgi:phosphoglycerol transferase MdoB-like AlkP superfamily enzyme
MEMRGHGQQEKVNGGHWGTMVLKFVALLLIFSAARLLFFLCNFKFFCGESAINAVKAFAVGLRFDASIVAIFNAPIWIFWSLPLKLRAMRIPNILAESWFITVNFAALLVSVIDARYFSFTLRRMGGEIFGQSVLLAENVSIYLDMLLRYWYVVLAGLILTHCLLLIPRKLRLVGRTERINFFDLPCFLISVALLVICVRGGLQRKPLKPADCNVYAPTQGTVSLANNTAGNIFHTARCKKLPPFKYYADGDPRMGKFSPMHGSVARDSLAKFRGKNVFIIILESFSAEYIGALDSEFKEFPRATFTPFLDSLIEKSYVFDGFANGTTSVDALTSIVLGIPPLFGSPYVFSEYAENAIDSLPLLLETDGYGTMFFYGGKRNSCHFNSVRKKARIGEYYCEDDYDGPPSDISGWGVYDEEFLQFAARKVDAAKRPFLAILFTLSSHHPFVYPARLHGKFPRGPGGCKVHELVGYTDYALRKFFETAEKMDWYKDTLFVIVADHTSSSHQRYYKNSVGRYSIPLVFFDPNGGLIGRSKSVAQQIDIMPSILDMVGGEHKYFSLGSSLFDGDAPRFSISYGDGIYQLIGEDFICKFDGRRVVGLFARSDFLLEENLAASGAYFEKAREMEEFLKSFLQCCGESLRNNTMRFRD